MLLSMLRFALILSCALAAGCGARSSLLDVDDAGPGDTDAGEGALDAARPMDAGRDAGTDAGADAGPVDTRLGDALQCDMTPAVALRAAVRETACWDDGDDFPGNDPSVSGLYEAWEAGLFGSWEPGLESWLAGFRRRGCEAWRCAAAATSCADLEACDDAIRIDGPCEPGSERCDGDRILRCPDARGFVSVFDCASVGARCNSALCQLGDCVFGGFSESLSCDGDALSICEGAIATPCSAHGPGDVCASFYVGGELPTRWCGPTPDGAAGGYHSPVDCAAGVVSFTSVSGAGHSFDCAANGYSGCDDRGCVP